MNEKTEDRYIIFHKDIPVLSLYFNEKYKIDKIEQIFNYEHLFPGLFQKQLIRSDVEDWFFSRGIPTKRKELHEILKENNVETREELIVKNYGLGLTDCYWIKKENDNNMWKNINFFENNFSQDNKDLYLGKMAVEKNKKKTSNNHIKHTPNNVSSGMLPKIWQKENDILYMIKGSELSIHQEPFNEKVISDYLDILNIDHVKYDLIYYANSPYSKCANMLKKDEELIHAYYIINMSKKDNKTSYMDHYINNCKKMGLNKEIRKDLENMLLIDYITANTDRHWSNFGVIRDAETLKVKKLAPLYDNGAALFAKIADFKIAEENKNLKCQSFGSKLGDSMRLINDFSLLKNNNIDILPDIINKEFNEKYIYKERKQKILYYIKMRISAAKKRLMNNKKHDNTEQNNSIIKNKKRKA